MLIFPSRPVHYTHTHTQTHPHTNTPPPHTHTPVPTKKYSQHTPNSLTPIKQSTDHHTAYCHETQTTGQILVKNFLLPWRNSMVGQCHMVIEDSRSYSDTTQSVGLLWTSDQPAGDTSTWQQIMLTTDRHPWPRWDSNPQPQKAGGSSPTP